MSKKYRYIVFFLFVSTFFIVNSAFCQEDQNPIIQDNRQPAVNSSATETQIIKALKDGNYDLAIESAKGYLSNNPNSVAVLNVLSNAYLFKGDNLAAAETIKKALEIEPNNSLAKQLEGQLNQQGTVSPGSATETQIIKALKDGNYDLAIESAKGYLSNNPNSVAVLNVLSNAYLFKGDNLAAAETIKKALEIEPNNSLAKQLEGQLAQQKIVASEKPEEAKAVVEKSAE